MKFKEENLLYKPKIMGNGPTNSKQNASIETRALQLFKVAEFLEDYFNQKYGKEVFQARCLWCKVQLDQTFFDKLTTASQC